MFGWSTAAQGPRLALEALEAVRILGDGSWQDLERDLTVQLEIASQEHRAHAALSEPALDLVAGELLSGLEAGRQDLGQRLARPRSRTAPAIGSPPPVSCSSSASSSLRSSASSAHSRSNSSARRTGSRSMAISKSDPNDFPPLAGEDAMTTARTAALQSVVMLKNDNQTLPLSSGNLQSIALIGPLTDAPYQQLGTWIFDGDADLSVTPLQAIQDLVGEDVGLRYVRAMENSRSKASASFDEAVQVAAESDIAILFLGEESILSGEAHSRADIGLPGDQAELVRRIRSTGKPVVAVIMAGRPLILTDIVDEVDAIFFAWHPGTMGGPAIADLLFGVESPSGKLPATFPRMVGQIPIYYSQKNTGKPPSLGSITYIDDIDSRAPQTSLGMASFHLDAGFAPLFEFGYGLSYGNFEYHDLQASAAQIFMGESLTVSVELLNSGNAGAEEVVQLYVRDLVGSVTRPVKELKGFQRVRLDAGESRSVEFELHTDDLAFYGRDMRFGTEPGRFQFWIGGSCNAELQGEFEVLERESSDQAAS